jgi:N-acetylmuramic acid 6-phosphate etherase
MSGLSRRKAEEFLAIASQFKLGDLVTESSHPLTSDLSDVARESVEDALALLVAVDDDVLRRFRRWVGEGSTRPIADTVLDALSKGGRICFTGCGSTGRLSILLEAIWRSFWQQTAECGRVPRRTASEWENRVLSGMAGGDFALIKAVEGFEDLPQFGRRQIADLDIGPNDVVFAITEGGETPWVIGTAWEAVDRGALVYFVYNNPDEVLCANVHRSRKVIEEPRIRKVNLTTGPMAITGSTRMQATTIQLCVLFTILEWVVRALCVDIAGGSAPVPEGAPVSFLHGLEEVMAAFHSPELLRQLADAVRLEESVYRSGHRSTYYADSFALDVLTDTTERSPTFCTPPFRRYDDTAASESWAFLTVPRATTEEAWRTVLRRKPRCIDWPESLVRQLAPQDAADRIVQTCRRIGAADLMRFRVGLDGVPYRPLGEGDCAIAFVRPADEALCGPEGCLPARFHRLHEQGVRTALVRFGTNRDDGALHGVPATVFMPVPPADLLLDGVMRVAVKMLLNDLSTCTMVRLGRVMGNTMIWVVPSNRKLIDRATRYVARLTSLSYDDACRLLFEAIEYVTPRMTADQAYPPVVGLSVVRARFGVTLEEAERLLWNDMGASA